MAADLRPPPHAVVSPCRAPLQGCGTATASSTAVADAQAQVSGRTRKPVHSTCELPLQAICEERL